ncbi:MAG: DUF4268 domain-containing protein [Anaerolineales bacterium]
MPNIGSLENVGLREIWPDEARDFTPWLATKEGLTLLGEVLGVELELISKESRVGPFKADIVARIIDEDEEQKIAIIENQLELTNHDHLGKIITYAAGHSAEMVVWIAETFTDEHRQAIEWLNGNVTNIGFFALEIQLLRIGNSPAAPQYKVISRPNEWVKAVRTSQARELTDVKLDQLHFWEELIQYASEQEPSALQVTRKPRPQHWYNLAVGRTGFRVTLTVNSFSGRVGCEVFMYDDDAKKHFDALETRKAEIEAQLGYLLEWQRLEEKKGSRIAVYSAGLIDNLDQRPMLVRWLFEKAVEFHRVFSPIVQRLG